MKMRMANINRVIAHAVARTCKSRCVAERQFVTALKDSSYAVIKSAPCKTYAQRSSTFHDVDSATLFGFLPEAALQQR